MHLNQEKKLKILGIKDRKTKREKILAFSLSFLIVIILVFILISEFLPAKFLQELKFSKEPEKEGSVIEMAKKAFNANEDPEFLIKWQKEEKAPSSSEIKSNFQASLVNAIGKEVLTTPIIEKVSDDDFKVKIQKPEEFRPGVYKLKVEYKEEVVEQEFSWGVLAINTNKSIYLPNENTYLQMAVLSEYGHTICNANLRLEIQNPKSETTTFSTADGTITSSDTCGPNNVTDNPDYFAYYQVNQKGMYQMRLTNLDTGYQITDSFEVKENIPFDIERIGATRINSFKSTYRMTLNIKANQDFDGEAVEKLPSGFEVVDAGGGTVKDLAAEKEISWKLNLKKGEQKTLQYEYQAPKISPQLFLLGPVELREGGEVVFEEARQWQLASDAARYSVADGNWNSTGTWSATSGGASGASVPVAGDTVTIEGGWDVTVTAAAACATVDFTTTTATSLTINSGITLDVSGAITIPRSGANINLIAVGAGILNAASISFTSGGTTVRHQVTISTGTVTVTGNIVGANASASVTFTGAGTLNAGGAVLATGTLTTFAGSTVNYNGAAQTVKNVAYLGNLTLSGSGAKTMGNAITSIGGNLTLSGTATATTGANLSVSGNLSVGDGTTFTTGAFTLTITGTTTVGGGTSGSLVFSSASNPSKIFIGLVTINSGASWTENAAVTPIFRGGITNSNTFTSSTGVHTFNTNSQALIGTFSIPSATVTGVTLTNNEALTVATALSGTGGLTQGSTATLNLGGTSAITTLTATAGTNTVNYNAAGAQATCKVTTYVNLTISGSGAKTFATTPTVNGILSMEGTATIVATTGVVTYGGSATLQYNTATPRTATAEEWVSPFTGTGGIIIANTGAITTPGAVQIGNNTSVPLNINSNAILTPGANLLTFHGDFINEGTLTSGSGGVTINGTVATQSIDGFTTTGTVSMTKTTGTATLQGNVNGAGLTLNGNGGTLHLGTGLTHTFTGDWTRSNGTLNGGSSTLKIGGSVSGSTGTFTANTGTVEWTASGGGKTIAGVTYNNLTLSNSSNTNTAGGNLIVNGILTTTSGGTLDMTAAYTLSGTLGTITNNGTISTAVPTVTSATPIASEKTWGGTIIYAATAGAQTVVTGTYTTLTLNNTSGTDVASGAITATTLNTTADGTLNMVTYDLEITNVTNAGTIRTQSTSGTPLTTGQTWNGTVQYDAAGGQTVVAGTYNNLTLSTSGAKTMTGVTTVNGNFTMSGSATTSGMVVTTIGGNVDLSGTAQATTGAILAVSGTVSIHTGTSLTIGAFTFSVALTTTVDSGGSIIFNSAANPNKTFTGDATVNGVWNEGANAITPTFAGNLTNNATTWTVSTGAHTFSGSGKTISGSTATVIPSVSISGTIANSNILTVATLLTIAGTLTNNGTVTATTALSGAGGFTNGAAGTLNIGAASAITTLTATAVGNTVNYTGASQTVKAATYYNLTLNGSGTPTLTGLATINGDFTISGTVSAANNDTLTVAGTLTVTGVTYTNNSTLTVTTALNGTGGLTQGTDATLNLGGSVGITTLTATASGNTVNYNSTSQGQTFRGTTYNSLTIDKSGQTGTLEGNIVVNNDLTISNGELDTDVSHSYSITLAGSWSNSGTFTPRGGTVTFNAETGTKTIAPGGSAFNNIVFNDNNGDATFRVTQAIDINGTFTLTDGILDLDTNDPTVNIADDITINGGSITKGTGTVIFDGDLIYDDNIGNINFGNIQIGTSPDTTDLASNLICDSLTIKTGDTLNTNGYDIDSAGVITIETTGILNATRNGGGATSINIAGNWSNSGTFTADNSTVTFDGIATQTLSGTMTGSSAFYDLTITNNSGASASDCERTDFVPSIDFNNAAAVTVTDNYTIITANVRVEYETGQTYEFNNINWHGVAVGSRIFFRNSTTSDDWKLKVTGTQTAVSYVNVSRSDASVSGGSEIDADDGTNTDCGNNSNWSFTAGPSSPCQGEMCSLNYQVLASSINVGGLDEQNSASYKMKETIGEIASDESESASYKLKAGYRQMVGAAESTISLTLADDVNMSPAIGGVAGGTADGSAVWTVTTNNSSGYALEINASTVPALKFGSYSFADYTPAGANPDYSWLIAATDSEFGFTPEGTDIVAKYKDNGSSACNTGSSHTPDKCWYNFSTSDENIASSSSSNSPDGTVTTVKFKAQSGSSHLQVEATYTGTITVTATMN